jgi:hypothetical protein
MITQKQLKEVLEYDSCTGVFIWKASTARGKRGSIAGSIDKCAGYIQIGVRGKLYRAHRLACLWMTGRMPPYEVDHINHKRSDNRWDNLRVATHQENGKNGPLRRNNTSGTTGVSFDKQTKKWRASIMVNGKTLSIGRFSSFEKCVMARKAAEKQHGFHNNHGATRK